MPTVLLSVDLQYQSALHPTTSPSMKSARFDQFSVGGMGDATYQMMGEVYDIERVNFSFHI